MHNIQELNNSEYNFQNNQELKKSKSSNLKKTQIKGQNPSYSFIDSKVDIGNDDKLV